MENLARAYIIKQNIVREVQMEKKIKIFTLSDMPLSPSGVGTQTKYICEALLETGKFQIRSFGGAIKHPSYKPIKTQQYGDDWIMYPVDGYGTQEQVRSLIHQEKPDILWFMTDPRFWRWLWEMENEIRPLMPMVYYHVWDNYPYPTYNRTCYESNDYIAAISKVTHDIVSKVAPAVNSIYLPHAVDTDIFKPLDDENVISQAKKDIFGDFYDPDKFTFFWNNRNARRKQSGSLIFWFKEFLDKVGHDKATLVMHTEVKDQHGQDLEAIIKELGLTNGEVLFSQAKVPPDKLALMYNVVDCTINVSDAEGFGLATLESLACGTPIIVNMTGGLQEQVTDGENWFGIGIEPSSKAIIGSQDVPYIYEDRINKEDFISALTKMVEMSPEEREALGQAGCEHVRKNYSFDKFTKNWIEVMDDVIEKNGSWETRKNYKTYEFTEL